MDPISPPKGTYSQPPEGKLPACCPECGAVLAQFTALPANKQIASVPALLRPTEKIRTKKTEPQPAKTIVQAKAQSTKAAILRSNTVRQTPVVQRDAPALGEPSQPRPDKITVFVLLYGPEHSFHRRCLNSIINTTPIETMDLRIICNQVTTETVNLIKPMPATKVYTDHGTRRKYQAMQEVFNDPQCPINTDWLVWFDDVSYVRHQRWLDTLFDMIAAQDPIDKVGMFGIKMRHPLQSVNKKDPRPWFKGASWFRGRDFRNKLGVPATNGDQIHFTLANFFALQVEAMRVCKIPDSRISQSGGGIVIGEQLYQGGYASKQFNVDHQYVSCTQPTTSRGRRERYPWQ